MKTGKINLEELNLINYEEIKNNKKGFFEYNNLSYFYKRCNGDLAYRELIAHEIANLLNIPSTFYQIIEMPKGYYESKLGVVAKDFRKKDTNYTKGYFVLKDFFYDYLKEWNIDNDRENNKNFNNLEDIWKSLEYRYRFLESKNKIVEKLLEQIIYNLFLFDIFISNGDRHFHNWEVVDAVDNNIFLNKNYDNEDMLLKDYKIPEISVSKSTNKYDFYDTLKEFLKISDYPYLEQVKNMYYTFTPDTLIKIFKITEKRHNIVIPISLKKEIIKKFQNHYLKIGMIISEFIKKENKIIILHKPK